MRIHFWTFWYNFSQNSMQWQISVIDLVSIFDIWQRLSLEKLFHNLIAAVECNVLVLTKQEAELQRIPRAVAHTL